LTRKLFVSQSENQLSDRLHPEDAVLIYEHLPPAEQLRHYYTVFDQQPSAVLKNRYLHQLAVQNSLLFYQLVQQHLKEMLPILYTPTVGMVVQGIRQQPSSHRGLSISWMDRHRLLELLEPYQNTIKIAILTDGERVLGLGDQGIGGIEICIAKAMLYTLCAGLPPHCILPIYLDVGTNNAQLLADPMYQGWRHNRLTGAEYDEFIDAVVTTLYKVCPNIYLHWEDFSRDNARRILLRYQDRCCTFNDDMQGTGVVTLAGALTAIKITKIPLIEQRIVIFGGGTAGIGIADRLCQAMQRMGLSQTQAQRQIWLVGRHGLLFTNSQHLTELQKPYARPADEYRYYRAHAPDELVDLLAVVSVVKPTFLIGTSGKAGAFTQDVVTTMAQEVDRPIIFPLSNPTQCCEAQPKDILAWTKNKALIATGSPFEAVMVEGKVWPISQCNNALAFPGIGLGVQASGAQSLTDEMLWQACLALYESTPQSTDYPILLPDISQIHQVSAKIAYRVCQAARSVVEAEIAQRITAQYWSAGEKE
jgi:malate dehydrogenase (oxaloacetate-decarboxylating)